MKNVKAVPNTIVAILLIAVWLVLFLPPELLAFTTTTDAVAQVIFEAIALGAFGWVAFALYDIAMAKIRRTRED